MNILGINAYHGDAAACLVKDGQLIAAAEEERFRRVKHWAGFPSEAIKYCLRQAKLGLSDIDHVAANRDPRANLFPKIVFTISHRPDAGNVLDRLQNACKVSGLLDRLSALPAGGALRAKFHPIEHHRAHLASAFLVSPFDNAAVVSVDGFGDFVSAMWGVGEGGRLKVLDEVRFPHSLGLLYLTFTQYLGFAHYGDEYKVMGLAAYGKPSEMEKMGRVMALKPDGRFALDLSYFLHHAEGVSMTWNEGEPAIGKVYSPRLESLLGPARKPEEPIHDRHRDIAASLQAKYEEAFFHLLNHVYRQTRKPFLCLAGGCAMNSVANGKIYEKTPFKKVYVQAAAGDAGGAIGAAFYFWNHTLRKPRAFVMNHAYWGPSFTEEEISSEFEARSSELEREKCQIEKIIDENELCRETAKAIADGEVVGWFQGRAEWGPRALGNRSILCDPRRADMKDILNLKIKRRESFRPFAPSILREETKKWFETDDDVPFMLQVYRFREDKRAQVPAVTHVDGTGRLQTVTADANPLYYRLIGSFRDLTGVPLLLNTSFNESEPIVLKPREALDCFLRTKMDRLIMGSHVIRRG